VSSVVVASTDKAYGDHHRLPYDESFGLLAKAPYEVSKACADMIARSYACTYGLPIAITRCANIYGPGDLHWGRLVPGTIRSLLAGEVPVLRSDGTMARDYVFIDDAVSAHLALGAAVASRAELSGAALNFGTGTAVSVLDMLRRIGVAAGKSELVRQVRPGTQASNEIRRQCLSSAQARRWLGWRPTVSLDEGLRRTVAWYAEHLDGSAPRTLGCGNERPYEPRLVASEIAQ
jgi:CDP-glucose 4,6-dehydratase